MFSVTIPRLLAFCVWPFREYWLFCVWPCREYCHTSAILVTCWTNPVVYTLTVGTIPDPIVTRYSYFLQLKDKTKIFLVVLGKTTITFSMIITHWITASPNVQCMLHLSVIDFLQLHILCITWLPVAYLQYNTSFHLTRNQCVLLDCLPLALMLSQYMA